MHDACFHGISHSAGMLPEPIWMQPANESTPPDTAKSSLAGSLAGGFHTAESHVIGSGIGRALPARPRLVGGAILVGAQVRAAALHPLGDAALGGIEAV